MTTLRIEPSDGEPLPLAGPGQYLTLVLNVPGTKRPAIRCYSLSHAPESSAYEVTIKATQRPDGAPGLVSTHVQTLEVGDFVDAFAPRGSFTLDPAHPQGPLVFLAGGIGITPFMSMLEALAAGGAPDAAREVHLYYGVRSGDEHAFASRLQSLASNAPWLHTTTCYSRPRDSDQLGADFQRAGRVDLALIQETLPQSDRPYTFLICGPPAFLDSLTEGLRQLGVPEGQVKVEAFGAPSVRPLTRRLRRIDPTNLPTVRFARSEREAKWDPSATSLLDFAMDNGVFFPFACAAGHCGTCASALLEGEVDYVTAPQFTLREGQCLPCVAVPRTDVTLDV
ncbi:MAG: 2Fe-2S iron-sulfur cluster binding domain-containing protein [Planctomycetes bacterium]|nr:2Fe-2S iron-sulfur cluster binding domain-containing protein [Planctomycetota bacterium]